MILGIDASQANRKIRSGTEWYAFYLIEEFKKLIGERGDIEVRLYLRDEPQAGLAANLPDNFEFKILRWPFPYFWGQGRLSIEMFFHPQDVLFCPAHAIPLVHPKSPLPNPPHQGEGKEKEFLPPPLADGGGKAGGTYTTLHDIGFEDNPELYDKLSLWYHKFSAWFAIKKAARIFTISEFSKKRIIERYNCDPRKISVTYLGIDSKCSAEQNESILEKYGLRDKGYILFVGRLEPKKNILGMVKGYEKFLSFPRRRKPSSILINNELDAGSKSGKTDKEAPDLVLAGRKVRIQDVEDYLKTRPRLRNKIKFIGYVDRQDLPALYAGAAIFLFPTLYEGFGLPIVEAQACGAAVITSNITSNPEIAADGALIVDPRNIEEIANAIKELLTDSGLRNQVVEKGLENVKRFNWGKTAKETLEVILSRGTEGTKARGWFIHPT